MLAAAMHMARPIELDGNSILFSLLNQFESIHRSKQLELIIPSSRTHIHTMTNAGNNNTLLHHLAVMAVIIISKVSFLKYNVNTF